MNKDYELLILRKTFTTKSTIGTCFGWPGQGSGITELCKMLEDEARPEGVKIAGCTCIPARKDYRVKITYSNRFKRDLPIIYTHEEYNGMQHVIVDGKHIWQGVRFHSGNLPEHTEGCPLPGLTASVNRVNDSKIAFEQKLFPFIQNHPALKENALGYLRLQIINEQTI